MKNKLNTEGCINLLTASVVISYKDYITNTKRIKKLQHKHYIKSVEWDNKCIEKYILTISQYINIDGYKILNEVKKQAKSKTPKKIDVRHN